jgi:hypothetical protein
MREWERDGAHALVLLRTVGLLNCTLHGRQEQAVAPPVAQVQSTGLSVKISPLHD